MFRLIWMPRAFDRMSEITRTNPHRKAEFARALQRMATLLRTRPTVTGESRDWQNRVAFFEPLTVTFRASLDQQTVYILDVHLPG